MKRDFARAAFPTDTGPHALRRIAAVGALLSMDGELYQPDRYIIHKTAKLLAKAGYPIHPEPNIAIFNLLPPVSTDFLAAPAPADIVITCNVFNAPPAHALEYCFRHSGDTLQTGFEEFTDLYTDKRLFGLSKYHWRPKRWEKAAEKTGAGIVTTVGSGETEILTHAFEGEIFRTLIDSHAQYRSSTFGVLTAGFGFLARPDYLQNVEVRLNSKEPLGRRGLEILSDSQEAASTFLQSPPLPFSG